MKPLTRRAVTTGLAAAVTAIPAVGLCFGLKQATATVTPEDRIRDALAELEAAFANYYRGAKIQVTFNGIKPSMIEHGSVAVGMVLADRLHEEPILMLEARKR